MSEPARTRPALRLVGRESEAPPGVRDSGRDSGVSRHERPALPTMDDAEILAGVRRGDATAATAFHDRTRPLVDRTIVRLLGRGSQEHDDLAQMSMLAVVRSLDRFRGECSLDTWTSRVTAHTVYNEIRRRKIERRIFDRDAEADAPSTRDPHDTASDRNMLARIRVHLEALDPVKAMTLVLHDVSGYDLREIAEITEVSVMAAQSRLVRGRRELHERMLADPELAERLRKGDRS
jgi:RNA polymerase sigma-70 factor (ECF subfamily)